MEYKLTLPYPPSVNRLYVRNRYGGVSLSAEAQAFKAGVAVVVFNARITEPLTGALGIEIQVYRKAERGDLDNILKITLDSLNKKLWDDDRQIVALHAFRYQDKHDPRLLIHVWQMKESK